MAGNLVALQALRGQPCRHIETPVLLSSIMQRNTDCNHLFSYTELMSR
jgi:hypothetical protein